MNLNEIKKDIDPILNLFSGSDGGISFVRFYHNFLPKIYKENSEASLKLVETIKMFSRLCELSNNGEL